MLERLCQQSFGSAVVEQTDVDTGHDSSNAPITSGNHSMFNDSSSRNGSYSSGMDR